jgi:hypothetical protein
MTFIRSRRAGVLGIVLGIVLLVLPVGVWAQTQSPKTVGLFNMSAEAAGMSVRFGDPTEEPYPVAGGTVPETFSTLSTGPSGYALSSAAWPGPLLANAGSLANLLLPACVPQAGVCSPKPDSETTNLANYPVRAEAQSPGGRGEETVGPMTARVEGANADAIAAVTDFDSTGIVTSARTSTHSRSFIDGDRAVSLGESTVSGTELAGGVVKISSVRSAARISSDGAMTTVERSMIVQGLEIDGHAATVDEDGVHVEGEGGDPGAEVTGPVNENILAPFGMEMFLTRPREERKAGGEAVVHTGALVVLWTLGDSGQQILVTLGGAGAHVQASPGFLVSLGDGVVPPAPAFGGPSGTIGAESLNGGNAPAAPSGGFTPQLPERSLRALGAEPAGSFEGIAPGWVIVGVLGGILIGLGLRRVQAGGLVAAGACENEGRT